MRGDLLLWDVRVVAGAYAHGVMPCQRKCPPDQATENGLTENQRENVAIARE
jgi:hypothetical protein